MSCLSSTAIVTLLNNESYQIAISQLLGFTACAPQKCRCGATVDKYSLQPFSCRLNAGCLPWPSALNEIIKCTLSSVGFNAVLEHVGLDRGDGKRPDGNAVFPFSSGAPCWCRCLFKRGFCFLMYMASFTLLSKSLLPCDKILKLSMVD